MRLKTGIHLKNGTTEYPSFSILLVMALILLAPFVSAYLCYAAFLICIYRMICYNVKVFATDYCILMPVARFFCTTAGMSFLIWLCLIAAVWYFFRGKKSANAALVFLLVLLNYLIARMQMNIGDFVLFFGQIFIMYVLLPRQDAESAERAAKAFCWSLIVTSVYALVLRNTVQLIAIRGRESPAIWGTTIMRFSGLVEDPNYYMTFLIAGMALLCKLKDAERISPLHFWGQILAMTAFGILTYSKAFFLVFVMLVGIYIIWQFWSRKYFRGVFFAILAVVAAIYFLSSENSPFAVVLERFTSGKNLSDFTTNRSVLFIAYWKAITKDVGSFLFGKGLAASLLTGWGAHNLYLEIAYYLGIVGIILIAGFVVSMISVIKWQTPGFQKQNIISKYVVLMMVAVVYCSLQGMFLIYCYSSFNLAFLSMYITKKSDI